MVYIEEKGSTIVKACIVVAILIILAIIILFVLKKDDINLGQDSINYEYFPLYSIDEKVGIINKKGEIIVEPKFINVYIPNPSIDVFACETEDGIKFYNIDGKPLFEKYDDVYVIYVSESTQDVERNVLSYKDGEKYGLIDIAGNKLTNAIYDSVSSLESRPGMILVKKDNKYGLVDSKGKVILDTKYNAVKSDGYSTAEDGYGKTGYIISERTNDGIIYGYVKYDGEILVSPKYESIQRVNKNSDDIYLIVMERGKKGVIRNKKQIIKNNYQSVSYLEIADIFVVEKVEKYGFFSVDGKEILKPAYPNYVVSKEYITVEENKKIVMYDFHGNVVKTNNYASVSEVEGTSYFIAKSEDGFYSVISKDVNVNNKYTYLEHAFGDYFIFTDETNKSGVLHVWKGVVVEPEYEYIIRVEGRNALEARDESNVLHLYNSNLEKVFSLSNAVVQNIDDKYTVIYSDSEMKYINMEGAIVENTEVYPDNKLYSVQKDGMWGYINNSGTLVVPCKYDLVTELNRYGFAGVKQDGKWGVINDKGEEIVVPAYEIESYYFPQFVGKYELQQNETTICVELEEK